MIRLNRIDMSIATRRTTLADVAQACGYHISTVQAALAGRKDISEATREKIQHFADRLGYVPDPMLSALAAYRNRKLRLHGNSVFRANLAWLWIRKPFPNQSPRAFPSNQTEPAVEAARSLGYGLEVCDIGLNPADQKQASRVLYHRGVRGIVYDCWPYLPDQLAFDGTSFARLVLHKHLGKGVHCAVHEDFFAAMTRMVGFLADRGYRKPGWITPASPEGCLTRYELEAAYRQGLKHHGLDASVPLLDDTSLGAETLLKWIRKWKPDCVLSHQARFRSMIESCRPGTGMLALLEEGMDRQGLTGPVRPYRKISQTAIRLLHSEIMGAGASTQGHGIEVTLQFDWFEGDSIGC